MILFQADVSRTC